MFATSRHPRPTAIPILKPQVLGIPYGCHDGHLACPIHCCAEDSSHSYSVQSNVEIESDLSDLKFADFEKPNNQTVNISGDESTTTVISSSSGSTLGFNQPPFDTKFEPNESKRKRTDKGLAFGKYSSSVIQDIHHVNEHSKSGLRRRRRRRETSKSTEMTSQNIHHYPRKDLSKSVEFIKLIELNATIDYSYCTKLQCTQGIGTKFHYIIPISKYMDLEYVTLQFK